MNQGEKYESLKAKLRKLAALAERGVGGEATNARRLMEQICREHGVCLDEVLNVEEVKRYEFEIGRRKTDRDLFMQCYVKVTGKRRLSYRSCSRSRISVELTAYQYAEISSLFEWHKENFKRDVENLMDTLFLSYCQKHSLFRDKSGDEPEEEYQLTPEDIRKLFAAAALRDSLNDNSYCKLIER